MALFMYDCILYTYVHVQDVLLTLVCICGACMYSGTSDSGPSEIGKQYNRPLYKGHRSIKVPKIGLPRVLIHFEPPKEDNFSIQRTQQLNLYCPYI